LVEASAGRGEQVGASAVERQQRRAVNGLDRQARALGQADRPPW
jgi:hypothetical protein